MSENLAWRYVKMTCDTTNKDLEEAYLFFVNEIEKSILEEIQEFKKKRLEEEINRKDLKNKFGNAPPKEFTIEKLEKYLNEKF